MLEHLSEFGIRPAARAPPSAQFEGYSRRHKGRSCPTTISFAPLKFQVANCEIVACLFGRRRVMIAWKKVPLEGFVWGWWQGRRRGLTLAFSLDSWKWWIMDYTLEEVRDRKGRGVIQKYEWRWHFQANSPPPGRLHNPAFVAYDPPHANIGRTSFWHVKSFLRVTLFSLQLPNTSNSKDIFDFLNGQIYYWYIFCSCCNIHLVDSLFSWPLTLKTMVLK